MSAKPKWTTWVFGLLIHPDQMDICSPNATEVELVGRNAVSRLRTLTGIFSERWEVDVRAICPLTIVTDPERYTEHLVVLCEHVGEPQLLDDNWVPTGDVASIVPSAYGKGVCESLEEVLDPDSRIVAWTRPGFASRVEEWIASQTSSDGTLSQMRISGRTCLLRYRTEASTYVFKMANPYPTVYASEPRLFEHFHTNNTGRVPPVVAIEPDRGWLLTEDLRGRLKKAFTLDDFIEGWRLWGQIQQDWIGREDDILAFDCPDRSLTVLESQIEPFINDPMIRSYLDEEMILLFEDSIPLLHDLCRRLEAFGLPRTLVHGDFFDGNMGVVDGQPVYFDWTDACLAHPFMDMKDLLGYSEADHARVRDAYLNAWRSHTSIRDLEAAWQLARPLSGFHHAVRNQKIVCELLPLWRPEFDHGVRDWTRFALENLEEYRG